MRPAHKGSHNGRCLMHPLAKYANERMAELRATGWPKATCVHCGKVVPDSVNTRKPQGVICMACQLASTLGVQPEGRNEWGDDDRTGEPSASEAGGKA